MAPSTSRTLCWCCPTSASWCAIARTTGFRSSISTGKYLDEWTDLARPDDVCVDDAGNVYVAELGERAALFPFMPRPYGQDRVARISVLDLDGKVLMRWGDDPSGGIQFVAPHNIAIDSTGSLYVGEVREAAGADATGWRKAVRKLARIA